MQAAWGDVPRKQRPLLSTLTCTVVTPALSNHTHTHQREAIARAIAQWTGLPCPLQGQESTARLQSLTNHPKPMPKGLDVQPCAAVPGARKDIETLSRTASTHVRSMLTHTPVHTRTFDRPLRATKKQQFLGSSACCNDESTSSCRAVVLLRCEPCPCWERGMCDGTSPICRNGATPSFRVCGKTAPLHKDSTRSSVGTTTRRVLCQLAVTMCGTLGGIDKAMHAV
jgi:hypothetical protein